MCPEIVRPDVLSSLRADHDVARGGVDPLPLLSAGRAAKGFVCAARRVSADRHIGVFRQGAEQKRYAVIILPLEGLPMVDGAPLRPGRRCILPVQSPVTSCARADGASTTASIAKSVRRIMYVPGEHSQRSSRVGVRDFDLTAQLDQLCLRVRVDLVARHTGGSSRRPSGRHRRHRRRRDW